MRYKITRGCPEYEECIGMIGRKFGAAIMEMNLIWWDSEVWGVEHFGDSSLTLQYLPPYLLRQELRRETEACDKYLNVALRARYLEYTADVTNQHGIKLIRKKRLNEDMWNESPISKMKRFKKK